MSKIDSDVGPLGWVDVVSHLDVWVSQKDWPESVAIVMAPKMGETPKG